MIWFLSGLGMLFGSVMLGYIFIRLSHQGDVQFGSLALPRSLWLSSALVVCASITVQIAFRAIKNERQTALRLWLLVTLFIGVLFCAIQTPSLGSLVRLHFEQMRLFQASGGGGFDNGVYTGTLRPQTFFGIIFTLILVHAIHVIGGLIFLVFVIRGSLLSLYDHEYHNPVKHVAMYWHFLDVVWIIMFFTIYLLG